MNTPRTVLHAVVLAVALAGLAGCGSDPKITVSGTTSVSKAPSWPTCRRRSRPPPSARPNTTSCAPSS